MPPFRRVQLAASKDVEEFIMDAPRCDKETIHVGIANTGGITCEEIDLFWKALKGFVQAIDQSRRMEPWDMCRKYQALFYCNCHTLLSEPLEDIDAEVAKKCSDQEIIETGPICSKEMRDLQKKVYQRVTSEKNEEITKFQIMLVVEILQAKLTEEMDRLYALRHGGKEREPAEGGYCDIRWHGLLEENRCLHWVAPTIRSLAGREVWQAEFSQRWSL